MNAILGESAEVSERIAHNMEIQGKALSQAPSNHLVLGTNHLNNRSFSGLSTGLPNPGGASTGVGQEEEVELRA